ncbi:MAG: Uma2 family endonuclease [Lachnospiraceae bacterium]|nr:Uma2 family endonuclease [Lachnospiraceae bacterium]
MPPVFTHEKQYTIDDIYALPDGKRAELIDGQLYYMAPPNTKHQRILSFLHLEIGNYIRENKGTCEVFPAPFAVFLSADNSKYLEPDISVICDINKLNDHGCHGAPDWVIEIVSPSSRPMDYYTKLSLYRFAGVREYWIVDPMKQIVLVYDMENAAAPVIYSFSDLIKANIYEHLYINFSDISELLDI